MTDEQIRELATAYLDLLSTMTSALRACDHGYGFFSWSGRGFEITGHPPKELVNRIVKAAGAT
jgi:hypothetical protein